MLDRLMLVLGETYKFEPKSEAAALGALFFEVGAVVAAIVFVVVLVNYFRKKQVKEKQT